MAPHLPVDVWLLVLDAMNDREFLWATLRNTSRFLRDAVDAYLRHGLSQNWLVDLHYNDLHSQEGPLTRDCHIPMVFDRFSHDGTRMFFQQRAYQWYRNLENRNGTRSVRGWVPFMERYCEETRKSAPKVVSMSKPSAGPPLWEKMHEHWRNALTPDAKRAYLSNLRHATAIGRGDYPPYTLKIYNTLNDTELVDLEIDCGQREISFNWRSTYAAFFREKYLFTQAHLSGRMIKIRDPQLAACDAHSPSYQFRKDTICEVHVRRKRLKPWVVKNKRRMSPEIRWFTEDAVYTQHKLLRKVLRHDNLCEVTGIAEDSPEPEEIVPAKLADDHPDLLMWPWGDENRSFVPRRGLCASNGCTIL